jgi:hypothetical protein
MEDEIILYEREKSEPSNTRKSCIRKHSQLMMMILICGKNRSNKNEINDQPIPAGVPGLAIFMRGLFLLPCRWSCWPFIHFYKEQLRFSDG